jgi:hypothetical protein
MRFAHAASSSEAVHSMRVSSNEDAVDIWVLLEEENAELEEEFFRLEDELLSGIGDLYVSVHVAPLSAVDPRNLPAGETIFERS